MIVKGDPRVSSDKLPLMKVAAWACYGRGSGFEHSILSKSGHVVNGTSRYTWEAMGNIQENIRASTHYFPNSMLRISLVESSLLDAYEIERISMDLDHYIHASCKHYHRKFVDAYDPSNPRIMSSSLKRYSVGTKEDQASKETKGFGFRVIYKLCGWIEDGVMEKVQLPALKEGR